MGIALHAMIVGQPFRAARAAPRARAHRRAPRPLLAHHRRRHRPGCHGVGAEAVIEIDPHIRNSALSEFKVGPKRHTLITFNTLPHLDGDPASVTYA